ncbi:dihydrofolate reductase family protein [Mycolicibacterium sediminis]|uniref:Deaminase n=1 Tax=Mycolicibacterium sediminis TaxID=1286180 RepID=A0A7I7QQ48_9MYCO|nr:dihydrofolate reductase family protein [Mycolicibacterium sediminis]BBY28441.1 deaminase [Mycolicibacterium sediminis]
MGKVVVTNWVTLDGVMQAPGRPDEDTRDGFGAGGWATPFADPVVGATMGERMSADFAWLFGRRTYEDLLASWNDQGGPFQDALNGTRKYVASADAGTDLRWPNSELLHGDVPAEVAALKRRSEANLVIMGSGVLIASLAAANLIDEYVLMIAPIVVGRGRRLFDEGARASLTLLDCTSTSTGVVIATYST